VTIPSGTVRLGPRVVELANLAVKVNEAHGHPARTGALRRSVCPDLVRSSMRRSDVDASLLESLAGGAFTDASGRAR